MDEQGVNQDGERHLNRDIERAIAKGRNPWWWAYGEYRKHYKGLILKVTTGFAYPRRVRYRVVFGTRIAAGARELQAELERRGVHPAGLEQAIAEYDAARARPGGCDQAAPGGSRSGLEA
jgi:hypothetical protein